MAVTKSCPGSLSVREPRPEYVSCPNCHEEVEIWTNELSYPCPRCKTRVTREQTPSCIDWCPMAEECIGSEMYKKLKPQESVAPGDAATNAIASVLRREHDETQRQIALLRAAVLCLGASARASSPYPSRVIGQSVDRVQSVLDFFDREVRLHFRREEESLFPALEKHTGTQGSPTSLLLAEHAQVWQSLERLKDGLAGLRDGKGEYAPSSAGEVYERANHLARLLEGHIKKENNALLPLAQALLEKGEVDQISRQWQSI